MKKDPQNRDEWQEAADTAEDLAGEEETAQAMNLSENWRSNIVPGNRLWAVIDAKAETVDVMRIQDNAVTILRAYTDDDNPRIVERSDLFITQHDAVEEVKRSKKRPRTFSSPAELGDYLTRNPIIDDAKPPW